MFVHDSTYNNFLAVKLYYFPLEEDSKKKERKKNTESLENRARRERKIAKRWHHNRVTHIIRGRSQISRFLNSFQAQSDSHHAAQPAEVSRTTNTEACVPPLPPLPPCKEKGKVARPNDLLAARPS